MPGSTTASCDFNPRYDKCQLGLNPPYCIRWVSGERQPTTDVRSEGGEQPMDLTLPEVSMCGEPGTGSILVETPRGRAH